MLDPIFADPAGPLASVRTGTKHDPSPVLPNLGTNAPPMPQQRTQAADETVAPGMRPHEVLERLNAVLGSYGCRLRALPTGEPITPRSAALRADLLRIMRRTAQARLRLMDGTYGVCRTCGRRVTTARLLEVPWTEDCSVCESGGSSGETATEGIPS